MQQAPHLLFDPPRCPVQGLRPRLSTDFGEVVDDVREGVQHQDIKYSHEEAGAAGKTNCSTPTCRWKAGSVGFMPRKSNLPNWRENGGKWGGGGGEKWGKPRESGRGGGMGKTGGKTSSTHLAHININIPTSLGGTLGCLMLGKSLTCDPRLGIRLVGSDKRDFDITNILMLQKIRHSLHQLIKHQEAGNNKQTAKQAFPLLGCRGFHHLEKHVDII